MPSYNSEAVVRRQWFGGVFRYGVIGLLQPRGGDVRCGYPIVPEPWFGIIGHR
jgi:hypothetical protein